MHKPASIADVYEPVVTGIPPSNAFRNLVRVPDGSIRCYGFEGPVTGPSPVYLESRDEGLSWRKESLGPEFILTDSPRVVDEVVAPIPGVRSPYSGDYYYLWSGPGVPLSMYRSKTGIDGPYEATQIDHRRGGMMRLPLFLRHRCRVLVPMSLACDDKISRPAVAVSDDDGLSWKTRVLETIEPYPVVWPHKGIRWQNRVTEPTVVELSNGRLWMLLRTSTDNHYESFSDDGGDTWTSPTPSRFYGTITMPTLFGLEDGRLLFLWCNTTPLPERDHSRLEDDDHRTKPIREGRAEDVFTNRDAFHAAISEDDGKTWIGFRELLLNPARNDEDFALSHGGPGVSLDKSVHQAQALELAHGKILVAVGQHPACRRLLVFDPRWLYESGREDHCSDLSTWSVHQYLDGIRGHCSYDRKSGVEVVPHPDCTDRRAMRIARIPDARLVSDVQGAVWNFPACHFGTFTVRIMLPDGGKGGRMSLVDRWFNPTDTFARHFAMFSFSFGLTTDVDIQLESNRWIDLIIKWDLPAGICLVKFQNQVGELTLPQAKPSEFGISYVHFQSVTDGFDEIGFLLHYVQVSRS